MIVDQEGWNKAVENNRDPYGKACIDVAQKVMEILDAEPGDFNAYDLVSRADKESEAGGITGFMAGCVASMVSHFHSRGEEFRKSWNGEFDSKPRDGVVNPALVSIGSEGGSE
jgi:hypothetical protein